MPPAMQRACKRTQPDFRPWALSDFNTYVRTHYQYSDHQLPFAVQADFNGDGLPDLIVDGRTRKSALRLGFMSPQYEAQVIESHPLKDPRKITYEVPGKSGKLEKQTGLWVYLEYLPATKLKPHLDGFAEVFFMKTTIYYQLVQGKFKEIYNAD